MADLQGPPAEVRMTIEIKRKATGEVEKYDLVGFVDPEKLKEHVEQGAKPKED